MKVDRPVVIAFVVVSLVCLILGIYAGQGMFKAGPIKLQDSAATKAVDLEPGPSIVPGISASTVSDKREDRQATQREDAHSKEQKKLDEPASPTLDASEESSSQDDSAASTTADEQNENAGTERHALASIAKDGDVVIFDDGSVWKVDPADQAKARAWTPTNTIEIRESLSDDGTYTLVNTDTDSNETIVATPVRPDTGSQSTGAP